MVSKAKVPSAAFFGLATSSSVVMLSPLYFYFTPRLEQIPTPVWGLLIATGIFQAFYYISLGNAYRLNDISLAYPLIRALPVLMVPLLCFLTGHGTPISGPSIAGMVIVAIGCIILPLKKINLTILKSYLHYPFLFVLFAAIGTTGYSMIDSVGLEMMKNAKEPLSPLQIALFYIAFENIVILGCLLLYVALSRHEIARFHRIRKESLRYPLMSGPAATIAYVLVLLAMQFASNVSYIVAFRQVSILLGVMLGVVILKEKITRFKIVSVILIFSGLMLVALGQG